MKKIIIAIFLLILSFTLGACNRDISKATVEGESEMQVVYDTAYLAKGIAEELLDKKLTAQGVIGYKIDGTAYGFATSETPYVFVSFLYSDGKQAGRYGYKFNVNEGLEAILNADKDTEIDYSNIFTILDEGVEIGA